MLRLDLVLDSGDFQTVHTFFLTATSVQSKLEKSAPHTAKLPPILGASRLIACKPCSES